MPEPSTFKEKVAEEKKGMAQDKAKTDEKGRPIIRLLPPGKETGEGEDYCPFEPILGTMIGQICEWSSKTGGGIHVVGFNEKSFFTVVRVLDVGSGKVLDSGEVLPNPVEKGDFIAVADADLARFNILGREWGFIQVDQSWTRVKCEIVKNEVKL